VGPGRHHAPSAADALISLRQPVAILITSVLPFIEDERRARDIDRLFPDVYARAASWA